MLRLAGVILGIAVAVALAVALAWSRTEAGQYWVGVAQVETGHYQAAEQTARTLIAAHPTSEYNYYRLLASALRRSGQTQAQLDVYDTSVRLFPDNIYAHGHRCWYNALFGDASRVMDSCERSVALSLDNDPRPIFWRGMARARMGDRQRAIADLDEAIARWQRDSSNEWLYRQCVRWVAILRAGGDPFEDDALKTARQSS